MSAQKKTLVITGSSGFVGQNLVHSALEHGFDVVGIDIKKSNDLNCRQIELDLSQDDFYSEIPKDSVIIHLASLSTDSLCKEQPILAIDANLRATALVLENAKKANASHFIFASSEWVYPERATIMNQQESDVLDLADLNSLYAMTKLFGESLIRSMTLIPYTILRFGIVYGPRKFPGSSAENIALKVKSGEEITVGAKDTSRCFIYLDDLISGILSTISIGPQKLQSKILNLAGSKLISLDEIVFVSNEILNKSVSIIDGGKSPSIRNPLIEEAKEVLGWKPEIGLREGLERCLSEMLSAKENGGKNE